MGSFNMEATQINYRRDDTIKTVDQKLQELSQESAIDTDIAPVFKSTSSYSVGDLVYYRNKLYTCTTPHSGAWAAADFTATDVTTAIKSAAAVKADEADIASAFDATASYAVGDLVYYGGTIYRCTNAHEGDWDADDFSATTISGELNSLNSNLTNLIKSGNISITISAGSSTGTSYISDGGIVPRSRIIGLIINKNDDFYYYPIVCSILDNGTIEALMLSSSSNTDRTYSIKVIYV